MSRFIVTSGSDFRPFSYEELNAPLRDSAEVHAAAADAYDQLSMETQALGRYISENEGDNEARALYNNYLNKLNTMQENLWNNGFTAQTRRDMSSARAAYANDITRLQSAIQTRQERSKEYWDARHKDPTLVAGFDPGTGGLDNYLKDSEYGRNWFSYSGTQFSNEVAADLKARAADLQQSYIRGGLGVPGYLEYVIKNGFSNRDINGGSDLARRLLSGDNSIQEGEYDEIQMLVASSLINNLQRTGANPAVNGNITPEEFNRLFNYGVLGASQGIIADDRKPIDDKVWEQQQKINLETHKHRLSAGDSPSTEAVHREPIQVDIEAPGAAKSAAERASIYDSEQFTNGNVVPINLPGGNVVELHNENDARTALLSDKARKFNEATGMDVTKDASNWWRTKNTKQTGEYKGAPISAERAGILDWFKGGIGIGDTIVKQKVNGKWVYNAGLTEKWNEAADEQKRYNKQIEELNPGKKISELGLTSKEAQQIRRDNPQIPAGVPDSDLIYVLRAENPVGEYLGVPIVYNKDDDDLKDNMANTILLHFDKNTGAGFGKTSKNGFYEVGAGNMSVSDKNAASKKGGLSNIFVLDDAGNIKPDCINAIYILPQDIKDGKVNVRIKTTKGTFVTDISTLGYDMDSAMNPLVANLIETALIPISNTGKVLDRNSTFGDDWDNFIYQYLYQSGYNIPLVGTGDGKARPAYADEVARSAQLQKQLIDGLNDYVRDALSFGIDPKSLRPRQHRSYTSDKAVGIYNQ